MSQAVLLFDIGRTCYTIQEKCRSIIEEVCLLVRREDIIKMDLQEGEWGTGLTDLAQNRDRRRAVVNAVTNLRVT